ncbi:unnamed protein product [Amoebophrya sp. A25]|nr:unnamed protein product [Amoebophrya sp. A25]|eukprot:GSA25T00023186001.1
MGEEEERKKDKNKLRPFMKAHREFGGTTRAFSIPGAFINVEEKQDRLKPNEDRIVTMLKDLNDGDRMFLGETRSEFGKTRSSFEGLPKRHITGLQPTIERHRAILQEETDLHMTGKDPFLNTCNRERDEKMVLNTLAAAQLSPTGKSKAKKEAQIPKVVQCRLFPATGKII